MPVKTTEELVGVQFAVRKAQSPVMDDEGRPVFNGGDGGPKLQDVWVIDFTDVTPFALRTISVPLSEANRDELVKQLTGGITIATSVPDGPIAA